MSDGSTGPGGGALPNPGPEGSWPRLLARATAAIRRGVARLRGNFTEAELRDLVANSTVLNREERRLIDDVLAAGDRHVRELMVPRTEVSFLDADMTLAEAAGVVRTESHSRFPVRDGTKDDVIGFVHIRDLLLRPEPDDAATVRDVTRELRQLPASKPALAALSEMRRAGDHFALVVDEYGGTAGIVTLEDIIEELVGEIHDEYDAVPEAGALDGIVPAEVDGLLNLNDFADRTGIVLAPGPYDTVGGYVMAALGRLATLGDEVILPAAAGGWRLNVVAIDGRRVARVALTVDEPPAPLSALRPEPATIVAVA